MKFSISKLLGAFGIGDADEDGVEMEFGPGVVGLTTITVIVALGVIGFSTYALSAHTDILLIVVAIVAGIIVLFLFGTWVFAHYHQDLALLGGSKLLQYRKLQMAAANPAIMIDATPTSAPVQPSIEPPIEEGPDA